MQLYLNHIPITCSKQVPPNLLAYRLPGTHALVWTDKQRFVFIQSVNITGSGLLYIVVQLPKADFLEIRSPLDMPFFAMPVSGQCSCQLAGDKPVALTATRFGAGAGSDVTITMQGNEEKLLRLLLIDIPPPVTERSILCTTHWLVSGDADAGLLQACLFLAQSSYYPAPLAIHAACLTQIADSIKMCMYGETGMGLLSFAEIRQLLEVKQYIMSHLRDALDAAWLAQLHAMRKSQLQKGFQYLFGQSPYRFIEQQRMELARRELGTHKTIKEITRLCGYRSVSNFTIAFKRYTGCTPGGYRRMRE